MRFSLRNVFLLPVVIAVGASFCLAQTGSITRIEENDASITYIGDWNRHVHTSHSGGAAMLTNQMGARAVVSFVGTGISWIGVSDSFNGPATVTIDGQAAQVKSYAPETHFQAALFTVTGLSNGPHKLSIEIKYEPHSAESTEPYPTTPTIVNNHDAERAWIYVDAFDVYDGMGVAGGLPAATGRIENDNPAVTYTGFWNLNASPIHSGGTAVQAVDPYSSASLNFNGTGVEWVAYRDEWSGIAKVMVDGEVKEMTDTFASPAQAHAVVYRIDGLAPGTHSLTIWVTTTKDDASAGTWIWFDAFNVIGSTTASTPVVSMEKTNYCVGDHFSFGVSNAAPSASFRLLGASNGQSWVMGGWMPTDANGGLTLSGVFGPGTEGTYRLGIEIAGKISNTVPVVISTCGK